MTDDPYEVLGIPRTATPDEVRRAHRQALLRYHPDRGGDVEAHRAVSEAGELLADPERRARFDTTGDRSGPPRQAPNADLLALLGPCLTKALEEVIRQGDKPDRVNVVGFMKRILERQQAEAKKQLQQLEAGRALVAATAERFREPAGEEEPLLAAAARRHLRLIDEQTRAAAAEDARIGRALEYLARCGYEFTPRVSWGRAAPSTSTFWGVE